MIRRIKPDDTEESKLNKTLSNQCVFPLETLMNDLIAQHNINERYVGQMQII